MDYGLDSDSENGGENFIRSPSFVKTQIRRISTNTRNMAVLWPPPSSGGPSTPVMMKRLRSGKGSIASTTEKPFPLLPDMTEPDDAGSAIFMVTVEPTDGEVSRRGSLDDVLEEEEESRPAPEKDSRHKKSDRRGKKKRMEKCRVS